MKNLVKHFVLFVITAAAGFAAISLPFRLFESLSQFEMRLVLAGEIAVLAVILSAVFLSKEARAQKKLRNAASKETRWNDMQRQIGGIGAGSYDGEESSNIAA